DPLCSAFILQALKKLGADLRPGVRLTAQSMAAQLGIVPQHHRLLERLLGYLEEDGVLVVEPAGPRGAQPNARMWEFVRSPDDIDPSETWRTLVADQPAFIAELMLLGRCGQRLAEVLRGEITPVQLIF